MTNKMTNRKALAFAIGNLKDTLDEGYPTLVLEGEKYAVTDVIAKLEAMAASLDNKATNTKHKPTKTQLENKGLMEDILVFLRENPSLLVTCTDVGKHIPALAGMNNQKISALMRGLVDAGEVVKMTEKGKSLFQLAKPKEGEDGDGE